MSNLLSQTLPLALAAAISPVLFLLQINTLTGVRPVARGAALTAGAAIVLILVSTVAVLLGAANFSTSDTLQAAISIALGSLLTLVGLRALLHPPKPKPATTDAKSGSVGRSFLAGAAGMGSNVTTFALYIPALAVIAGSDLPLGRQGIAALIILVTTMMLAWVPLVLAVAMPGTSSRFLPALGAWMTTNKRWIQVALGFGFGAWLLIKGAHGL